jgi:hypothetical protein
MRTVFAWKFLLPILQSALAIALWLYIPVQYRKEALEWAHMPSDHPFRFRFVGGAMLFPPTCEQLLYVMSFPAYAVSDGIVYPLLYRIEYSRQAGFPEWEFTLPVNDPEVRPPRQIFYTVHVNELIFLGLIVVLWCWVGWRIDAYVRKRKGTYAPRRRAIRVVELVAVAATLLFSVGFACRHMAHAQSPQARRVGILGLIWPAVLLAYIWLAARPELRQSRTTG